MHRRIHDQLLDSSAKQPRGERPAAPAGMGPEQPRKTAWAGYAASTWAFVFAALSFYWAAGGTVGVETQSSSIQELAETRDPWFVAVMWGTGILKMAGGLPALALVRPWSRLIPQRLLLIAVWSAGIGMVLYGGLGMVADGLRVVGVIPIPESADSATALWHLLLWDPWWLVGCILFVAAAWHYQRTTRTRSLGGRP